MSKIYLAKKEDIAHKADSFTGTLAEVEQAITDGTIKDGYHVFITDDTSGSTAELDSYEEIMANTNSGLLAGALGVKQGFTKIIEGSPQFVYDESTGQITGYTTEIGGADTVFPFKSGGLITVEHIITSGSTSVWTEFELEDTPKLIYAYRNTGNSVRYEYFFADVENGSIIFYGNTSSSGASLSFSTDFESLKSENGEGKDSIAIRIYDGKIGYMTTASTYLPSAANPLTLVYMY